MEVVAVERELGSGQGDIMTRTPNSKIILIILGHLALVMMLHSLPGIGIDTRQFPSISRIVLIFITRARKRAG